MNWEANLLYKVPLSFYCALNHFLIIGVCCENIWYVFPSLAVRILRTPMPVQSFFLSDMFDHLWWRPVLIQCSHVNWDHCCEESCVRSLWEAMMETSGIQLRSWISVQALAPGPFLSIGLPMSGCVLVCVSCWLDLLAWPQTYLITLNLSSDHWTIGWF